MLTGDKRRTTTGEEIAISHMSDSDGLTLGILVYLIHTPLKLKI